MMTAWRVIIIVAAAAAPAESLNSGNHIGRRQENQYQPQGQSQRRASYGGQGVQGESHSIYPVLMSGTDLPANDNRRGRGKSMETTLHIFSTFPASV